MNKKILSIVVAIISLSLVSSCAKLGFKSKTCSKDCAKKEVVSEPAATKVEKKSKKGKKAKKVVEQVPAVAE